MLPEHGHYLERCTIEEKDGVLYRFLMYLFIDDVVYKDEPVPHNGTREGNDLLIGFNGGEDIL